MEQNVQYFLVFIFVITCLVTRAISVVISGAYSVLSVDRRQLPEQENPEPVT